MMIWNEVFNRIHRFNRISARYDSIVVPLFLMLENYGCNNCIWHQTDCCDTKNYFHPYDSLIRINYARINILRYASIILVVWARKHDLSHCRIDRLAPCYLERLGTIFSSSGCWRGPITSFIFFRDCIHGSKTVDQQLVRLATGIGKLKANVIVGYLPGRRIKS